MTPLKSFLIVSVSLAVSLNSSAQTAVRSLTAADYERAEQFMGYNTTQLVDRLVSRPTWISGDRFWYRTNTPNGPEFMLVDPLRKTKTPVFNPEKLASALSAVAGKTYDAAKLPIANISLADNGKSVSFTADKKQYNCQLDTYGCVEENMTATAAATGIISVASPDGKRTAFIREHNLWVRDKETGKETQLTTDGIKDFGYATDNAGWKKSEGPILLWSPDSKKIATFQQDQRKASDMFLVTTNVGKPTLQAWKYPLPGDKDIVTIHRVIIEVDNPKVIRLKLPPDPHRGSLCDDIACSGSDFGDVEWNKDASQLAFVSTTRDHKQATVYIADAASGTIREVFKETSPTQFESGQGSSNWRFLHATNEILWYSERDNWGHLYLFDATTGKLKNQITKGDWTISQLLRVDEKSRTLYFLAGGREAGRNPYFSHLYKVNMDGKNLTLLTPEDGNHEVSISPSGKFVIDTYSKQNVPPVTEVRDATGKLVLNVEKADISRLTAKGWKPPTPFSVKARDGQTDLYGLMFTPTNLDPNKKYPVINYIYPGPQGGSIRNWGFEPATIDHQALAELGFIVVSIEGTCNPLRSKAFHDMCYGNMADNTLPDQISGMKQLAAKHRYIDLDRVGIWGHSGGGYATAAAMFRYPDFFKVGISESGNHDNRNYEDDWGERYIGLLKEGPDGKSNYEPQANQIYAKNLKGKLLLAHGMMDDNVPPYNTLLVVDALVKANKDFDLIMFPHARHGFGESSPYMTRRRWDYFVRHLLGANPPENYEMKPQREQRAPL